MTLKEKTTQIKTWLSKGPNTCDARKREHRKCLIRMLKTLWARQTRSEQDAQLSMERNGRGFNKNDAHKAGFLLDMIFANDMMIKDAWKAKFMLRKYARQLAEIYLEMETQN